MSNDKKLYELDLHEICVIDPEVYAMRVPGGWLYYIWDEETGKGYNPVFVPYHAEFNNEEGKTYGKR